MKLKLLPSLSIGLQLTVDAAGPNFIDYEEIIIIEPLLITFVKVTNIQSGNATFALAWTQPNAQTSLAPIAQQIIHAQAIATSDQYVSHVFPINLVVLPGQRLYAQAIGTSTQSALNWTIVAQRL